MCFFHTSFSLQSVVWSDHHNQTSISHCAPVTTAFHAVQTAVLLWHRYYRKSLSMKFFLRKYICSSRLESRTNEIYYSSGKWKIAASCPVKVFPLPRRLFSATLALRQVDSRAHISNAHCSRTSKPNSIARIEPEPHPSGEKPQYGYQHHRAQYSGRCGYRNIGGFFSHLFSCTNFFRWA